MRYPLTVIFILFWLVTPAQENISSLSKIKTITREEFKNLKQTEEGTIVMIKDEGQLLYFSNNRWYAMKGECYPKPRTPNIDSVKIINKNIYVYFASAQGMNYNVSIMQSDISVEATASPVLLPIPSEKKQYTIQLRAFSDCEGGSPMMLQWEYK
ncbi:MAG: hypothetical protein U0T77_03465 [Chitinophagales bacterium]